MREEYNQWIQIRDQEGREGEVGEFWQMLTLLLAIKKVFIYPQLFWIENYGVFDDLQISKVQ